MIKVSVSKLEAGMILAKPIVSANGMVLLVEGTELNETRIERINDMNIEMVFVEGSAEQQVPKEEMLAQLDNRFRNVEGKPYMSILKNAVKHHIESLYE